MPLSCNLGTLTSWNPLGHSRPVTGLILLLTQYCSGDKTEKNEMGGACSAYGGEERQIQGFGAETRGKETAGETQANLGG